MAGALTDKRILVVEDEYLIASDLKHALQREDAIVIGPVAALGDGLSLAKVGAVDAAVLDVHLGDDPSFPIADRLSGDSVPYLFLTGYDPAVLPDRYRAVPHVTKPASMGRILGTLAALVGRESA